MKRAAGHPNTPDPNDETPTQRGRTGERSRQTIRRRCPLRGDVRVIAGLSSDLAVALRRLKRRLKRCQKTCPAFQASGGGQASPGEPCGLLNGFHLQIQAAIATVMEEWDPRHADMTRREDVTKFEDVSFREID